ncbi:3-hydroxyacyl-CoA dehydrogenase NAD-binding domain-containing protein [Deinococcus lacus]|uniref:3-hydroxyacyl-CoA dehydrogenase NAD-binding domain-containing protein n=1 Tax=Deinococcus lacus TaxID=392561 RepID=A0ABW1Y9E0_9DEIO
MPREQAPDLRGFISRLDRFPKPVVAAIHGAALGGGLEVALACHYRVATPTAKLGLPEVTLGVLPGAGGTQRLPRLLGAEQALGMMLSGQPVTGKQALELGLVDALAPGDAELLDTALEYAQAQASQPLPRISERRVEADPELFSQARAALPQTHRGQLSPGLIVDLAQMAAERPFEEGWEAEGRLFVQAKDSPQARALRHAFFAERAAAKVPGVTRDTPRRTVGQVSVIGAGTMGGGIAMSFLNAQIPVTLVEVRAEALSRGLDMIRRTYEGQVAKGRITAAERDGRLALLTSSLDMQAVASADLVVEAAFESMEVKRGIFEELGHLAKPGAVLATNTSTLDVNVLAAASQRPGDVLGLHFFSPAHVMRLLEVVRADATTPETLATALDVAARLGKVAVVVGVCDGFVGNRMLYAYRRAAVDLVDQGASPEAVDAALRDFGLPMGPFEMNDMAGLDIGHAVRVRQAHERGEPEPDGWVDRTVRAGRLGQKTGAGIYDYPEGRQPVPSPETARLIEAYRAEKGYQPRSFDSETIQRRLVSALVNEAAEILSEGVAQRASDIDVIYLTGYGFPRYRGGPLQWADETGLAEVVAVLEQAGQPVAPLLRELAESGRRFSDLDATA